MIAQVFLGLSLVGAEWVLYFLILLSIFSVAVMVERWRFYSRSTKDGVDFRRRARDLAAAGEWNTIRELTQERLAAQPDDPDSGMIQALLDSSAKRSIDSLQEAANDALIRIRNRWDKNLVHLAIIGSNAPFVGLFGTVLGIITAFHQLASENAAGGVGTVMSGIAEALVATAVGLFVAIPAVVAFNLLQKKVKGTLNETEALRSFFVALLIERNK